MDVEAGRANCMGSRGLCSNAPACPPLPLAHVFSYLLRGPGTAEVILGTSTGPGFWPPSFPGNWKQVRTSPPQRLPPRLAWAPGVTGRKFMSSWSWLLFSEGGNMV